VELRTHVKIADNVREAAKGKRVGHFERRDQSLEGESSEGEIPGALRGEINPEGLRGRFARRLRKPISVSCQVRQAWVKQTLGTANAEGTKTSREEHSLIVLSVG